MVGCGGEFEIVRCVGVGFGVVVVFTAVDAEASVVALLGVVAGAGGVGGGGGGAQAEEGGEGGDGAADHADAEFHSAGKWSERG